MMRKIRKFLGEKGQGIVEYALILAFVVAVAAALTNSGGIKDAIEGVFSNVTKQLNDSGTTTNNSGTSGG